MRKILLAGALLALAPAVLHAEPVASTEPAPPVIDAVRLLPAPPQAGSPAQAADAAAIAAPYTAEQTAQAARDAAVDPFAAFRTVFGDDFVEAKFPAVKAYLWRYRAALLPANDASKTHFNRLRPYKVNPDQKTCVVLGEIMQTNPSYPSGHAALGWGWALALTEIAPAHSDAILVRGREFGESRTVCGVHWPSDVQAGQLMAAATVARLHSDPTYLTLQETARKELAAAYPTP